MARSHVHTRITYLIFFLKINMKTNNNQIMQLNVDTKKRSDKKRQRLRNDYEYLLQHTANGCSSIKQSISPR